MKSIKLGCALILFGGVGLGVVLMLLAVSSYDHGSSQAASPSQATSSRTAPPPRTQTQPAATEAYDDDPVDVEVPIPPVSPPKPIPLASREDADAISAVIAEAQEIVRVKRRHSPDDFQGMESDTQRALLTRIDRAEQHLNQVAESNAKRDAAALVASLRETADAMQWDADRVAMMELQVDATRAILNHDLVAITRREQQRQAEAEAMARRIAAMNQPMRDFSVGSVGRIGLFRVIGIPQHGIAQVQLINRGNMIVFLRGETHQLVSQSVYRLDTPFEVVSVIAYETVLGARQQRPLLQPIWVDSD